MKYRIPDIVNSNDLVRRIISQFAAEKKKTVMALCLITVMLILWAKMFAKKGPKSAAAKNAHQQTKTVQNLPGSASDQRVSFTDLPSVNGRYDTLARDFFTVRDWEYFFNGAGFGAGDTFSKGSDQEIARIITRAVKLEAIELGREPKAFINNKLLSAGDVFTVRDMNGSYTCEVVRIEENEVFIRCQEVQIQLKLAEVMENEKMF